MRPRTTGNPDRPARPPAPPVFGEAELEGLPEPVRRYLRASIAPGTPLATSARLRMRGRIKVGRWLPFHARQVLAPGSGFEWTARAGGVLSGFDRYADGRGEMRWKLFGWRALDDQHLAARRNVGDVEIEAHYRVDADGHLTSMVFDRWGDPWRTGTWGQHPFGGEITAYRTFAGLSIPSAGRFGWCYNTDQWPAGEFFRYEITALHPMV